MGRCCVKLKINDDNKELKWHKLVYKNTQAGEILATFELISIDENNRKSSLINKLINEHTLFKTKQYVLEVFHSF